jgi:hypothetical protein
MNTEGVRYYPSIYSAWFGIPVLIYVIRECRVPIPCNIIGESVGAVRISLQPGWECDVPKELILAVEEATVAEEICLN